MSRPSFEIEEGLPHKLIAGVDEAGRGPWAGPVFAAAVIIDPSNCPDGLNDSKKLSEKKREALYDQIVQSCRVGVGSSEVAEIDDVNILTATFRAMTRAIEALPCPPDLALIDGNRAPKDLTCVAQTVVKGDGRSLSIAAASIIAKVTRDRYMCDLAQSYPDYGWHTNKGYGTKQHHMSLLRNGVTPHHRRSFKPIHNILYQRNFVNI